MRVVSRYTLRIFRLRYGTASVTSTYLGLTKIRWGRALEAIAVPYRTDQVLVEQTQHRASPSHCEDDVQGEELGRRRRGFADPWQPAWSVTEDVIDRRQAAPRSSRVNRPPVRTRTVEAAPRLRLAPQLPLRQTEGSTGSLFVSLCVALSVTDHSTLSRQMIGRGVYLKIAVAARCLVRLWVDRTVRNFDGAGEWLQE